MVKQTTHIFGHRGSAGTHPENTMTSFVEAARVGADGLEIDVQLSKDGIPVVIHDERLERTTTGQGWVKDFSFEELRTLDAGSWFSEEFRGEPIPSLEEVLALVKDRSLLLNIELKNGIIQYPELEEKVIVLIEEYQVNEQIILSSFNHYSLAKISQLDPSLETGILYMEGLYEPWNYAKSLGARALHCYWPVAVPELISAASKAGMPVRAFTVNEDQHILNLINHGCTAIITDWPEKAIKLRGK